MVDLPFGCCHEKKTVREGRGTMGEIQRRGAKGWEAAGVT